MYWAVSFVKVYKEKLLACVFQLLVMLPIVKATVPVYWLVNVMVTHMSEFSSWQLTSVSPVPAVHWKPEMTSIGILITILSPE